MKALLITPETQAIEAIEVADIDQIKTLIGYDTLESDAVGDAGDRLFFDEECFIRGTGGRFQIDSLIPVAGKGVVIAADDSGASLGDVKITAEELAARTKFQ
jgi:hypothetical protein